MTALHTTALTGLFTLALSTPALTTAAVGEVVSDIQVSWADASHEFVRVTWQEEAPEYNIVQPYRVADSSIVGPAVGVEAEAPNEVLIPAVYLSDQGVLGVGVNGVASAAFDTAVPPSPVVTAAQAGYGESATLSWRAGDEQPDTTPGDPLDLPQQTPLYRLGWQYVGEVGWSPIGEFGTAMSATGMPSLPERRSYRLAVLTTPNEWGAANQYDPVSSAQVQATVTTASWTAARRIEGSVSIIECVMPCMEGPKPVLQPGRRIVLQHRTSPTGAWQRAAVVNSSLEGTYRFTSLKTRGQYRVVVPPADHIQNGFHHAYGGVRSPVISR